MYSLDISILLMLHSLSSPFLDQLALVVTQLGGAIFVTAFVGILVIGLIGQQRMQAAATLVLIVGGAGIINLVLKLLFERARPTLWEVLTIETTYSFPSGHAMASSALAVALIMLLWQTKWKLTALIVGIIYTLIVGLTRIYLGVHFPSDVIGGWIISVAWAFWVAWTVQRIGNWRTYRNKR